MAGLGLDRCRQSVHEPHPQVLAALELPRLKHLSAQYLAVIDEGRAHSYCAAVQDHGEDA